MAGRSALDPLSAAVNRLLDIYIGMQLGDVDADAGPVLIQRIDTELTRLGVDPARLKRIHDDVLKTATALVRVRKAKDGLQAPVVSAKLDSRHKAVRAEIRERRLELNQIIRGSERATGVMLTPVSTPNGYP